MKELQNGGTLIIPNIDSLEEFRVLTNNFDAQYGNYCGGIVNAVTKTGTNALHGSGFEFLRNTDLDARDFFSPEREVFRAEPIRRHASAGRSRKTRSFSLATIRARAELRRISSGLISVPSLADRAGNLSDQASSLTGAVGGPYLANLLTEQTGLRRHARASDIIFPVARPPRECVFPNAVIPVRAWSAPHSICCSTFRRQTSARPRFRTVPSAGDRAAMTRQASASMPTPQRMGLLTAYYFIDDFSDNNPYPTGQGGASVPGFNALNIGRGQLITLGHTKTFGAAAVNELRLSFMRSANMVGPARRRRRSHVWLRRVSRRASERRASCRCCLRSKAWKTSFSTLS